nr:hypothetical protein [Tanacetum cinerariifolium]
MGFGFAAGTTDGAWAFDFKQGDNTEVGEDVARVREYRGVVCGLKIAIRRREECIRELKALGDCEGAVETMKFMEEMQLDDIDKCNRLVLLMREMEDKARVKSRAMDDDVRLARQINALCDTLTKVIEGRENFVAKLDMLGLNGSKIRQLFALFSCDLSSSSWDFPVVVVVKATIVVVVKAAGSAGVKKVKNAVPEATVTLALNVYLNMLQALSYNGLFVVLEGSSLLFEMYLVGEFTHYESGSLLIFSFVPAF